MPTIGFSIPSTTDMTKEELVDLVAKVMKELEWVFSNLDAKNIKANSITANEIKASTITADRMKVTELSAITANLGTITAGIMQAVSIYGAYIATANGTFPRIELSNTANLLKAYKTLTNFLKIDVDITDPSIVFNNGTVNASIFNYTAFGSTFAITSDASVHLFANSGNISATSLAGSITDLVSAINSKAPSFSGYTGVFNTGAQVVTVNNGIITNVV